MRTIQEDLKTGSFRHIYLLYGDEDYLLQQYKNKLVSALCDEGDTFNFARYEGKDVPVREVIDLCETMPFLSDRRVILFEDTGFFKNKCDELTDYAEALPDYLYLIFKEHQVDKRNRLYKLVSRDGRAAELKEPDEKTLIRWIGTILSINGRKISARDASVLLERTGSDMGTIRNELEKLISYTEGRDAVTTADIDVVCSTQTVNRVFEMVRAAADKNQQKAMALYEDLLALKERPMTILFNMGRQFRQMFLTKQMQDEGTPSAEIARVLGVQPFVIRNLSACASRYRMKDLEKIIADFVDAEEAVKTGRLEDRLAVELMIIKCSK